MELLSLYKKCLSELLLTERPTSVMKKVIDTIHSPNERVYIYDVNKNYASLFLSDEMYTVYLYPDLTCSLLKPPSLSTIPHWSTYITKNTNNVSIDIELSSNILKETKEFVQEPFKPDSPNSMDGPDFGTDFGKEFDFSFEPIKQPVKPIKKLKNAVNKLIDNKLIDKKLTDNKLTDKKLTDKKLMKRPTWK